MRENLSLMLKEAEDLMLQDMENAKTLNALFALAFMDSICLQESQTPEISGEVWSKKLGWGRFKQNPTYGGYWDLMGYTQKCCGSWLMWGCSPLHLKDCSDQRRVFGMSRKQMPLRHSRKVRTTILGATDWPVSPQSWDISGNSFQTYERQGGNWELSAWRHRINWALGTPSSPTVKWVTFLVREGKKVDIALTLASLLLFIVTSSQSSRLWYVWSRQLLTFREPNLVYALLTGCVPT